MILSELKVTFAVLNFCNIHNSGNIACFIYGMFTRKKVTRINKSSPKSFEKSASLLPRQRMHSPSAWASCSL